MYEVQVMKSKLLKLLLPLFAILTSCTPNNFGDGEIEDNSGNIDNDLRKGKLGKILFI